MNQNSRLQKLETAAPARPRGPVLILPDNGKSSESQEQIRERWEHYLKTGECERRVLIVPQGEQMPGTETGTENRA